MSDLSTKPYLIRAIHEWCIDSGYRPHIAVMVDEHAEVPREFVRNGEIVLNLAPEATQHLVMGNERIDFEARFNRVARRVSVPVANVIAVYASENGHGMAFEVTKPPEGAAHLPAEPADRSADRPAVPAMALVSDAHLPTDEPPPAPPPSTPSSSPSPSPSGTPGGRPRLTRVK